MAHINIHNDLPFEIVYSRDDFFVSMDDLEKIQGYDQFVVLFERMVFLRDGCAPIMSAEIPPDAIEKILASSAVAFAKVGAFGVETCREIRRSI